MGIRLTGISTPIGGLEWEYTDKREQLSNPSMQPGQKIRVFISSICGKEKYDQVRSELKRLIENTGLATVYLFEGAGASSVAARSHYLYSLKDSDVCIFLIDNADGIGQGVQEEIDTVNKNNIKALYYFCDETQKEKTDLEESLRGAQFAKSKTVHRFDDLKQNGAQDLLDDIIFVYHHYCRNRLCLRDEDSSETLQRLNVTGIEKISPLIMPKTVLKGIDKSADYYLRYAIGRSMIYPSEEAESGDIDEWCVQFLPILFEGKSIKQFNVSLYLDTLKTLQTDKHFKIVSIRWQAIQAYFMGDSKSCIRHLEDALSLAKRTEQPLWVIKDILVDLRNQQMLLDTMNNQFAIPAAQQELTASEEDLYYPLIDRVNESLYQKIVEDEYKIKTTSPYTIPLGQNYNQYGRLLASSLIIAMYNGSLSHILLTYDKVRDFVFHLSCKYDDWRLRRNLLQLAVLKGKWKEIDELQKSYPAILNRMTADDALAVMSFCNNHPLEYRKFGSQLLALGAVAYYLSDDAFSKYEAVVVEGIKNFAENENSIFALGADIFKCLDGVAYRMRQETLIDICCLLIERDFKIWYRELFVLIADRINLIKVDEDSAKKLLAHIITVLKDEKGREQIKLAPRFLYVLRKQKRNLTDELDLLVAEYLPAFYSEAYRLETMESECRDMVDFVQRYVNQIEQNNVRQGVNGIFYGYAPRNAATIHAIFINHKDVWNAQLMDRVIAAASDTLLHSKESIRTKLDTISLLICIVLKFPEAYEHNVDIYNSLYEQREEIVTSGNSFVGANIDRVSIRICLNLLFVAMGMDTYLEILEFMPLVQDDIATAISIAKMLDEYLEVSDDTRLPVRVETIVLQYVLSWLHSTNLDLRCISLKILLALARNPENSNIISRQLTNLVDSDCVYIKNLILRKINNIEEISQSTKDYVIKKCESDPHYVVRAVCAEVMHSSLS